MQKLTLAAVAVAMFTVMLGGCAKAPEKTGFLSSYDKLEPVKGEETFLRYIGPAEELGQYDAIMVDPVVVHFHAKADAKKVKPEDIRKLASFFDQQLQKDLRAANFAVTSEAGPRVARVRVALTDLQPGSPALNVLPQTKLTGVGLGQAAGEAEIVDSVTGKQLAAAIKAQTGSRMSLSGLSEWGDAEAVIKEWSKAIVDRLSAARDRMRAPKP